MDDPPNWSNKMSLCSAAYNSPLSFFGFWNLTPLHIHLQTSNHSTGGRFLQHRPLLGPINLWWEQWLITREQEKIRPLRYWWFTIQFRGVNREPYLNCQCLIYTSCSCTKSAAAFFGLGGVLMEEAEGQVKLGRLPSPGDFWIFLVLWSDLDIQLVDNSFTLNLSFNLSPLVPRRVLFFSVFQSFCFTQDHYLSASFVVSLFSCSLPLHISYSLCLAGWTVKGTLHPNPDFENQTLIYRRWLWVL